MWQQAQEVSSTLQQGAAKPAGPPTVHGSPSRHRLPPGAEVAAVLTAASAHHRHLGPLAPAESQPRSWHGPRAECAGLSRLPTPRGGPGTGHSRQLWDPDWPDPSGATFAHMVGGLGSSGEADPGKPEEGLAQGGMGEKRSPAQGQSLLCVATGRDHRGERTPPTIVTALVVPAAEGSRAASLRGHPRQSGAPDIYSESSGFWSSWGQGRSLHHGDSPSQPK